MSTSFEIAKSRLNITNKLQEFLMRNDGPKIDFYSPYFVENFVKFSRSVPYEQKIHVTSMSDNDTLIYKIPSKDDFTSSFELVLKLPRVSLKAQYRETHRFSWCPKTLIYFIEKV